MKLHELKCEDPHFSDVAAGKKRFEWRKNDRDFQEGDLLLLRKWDPEAKRYPPSTPILVRVTSILTEGYELPAGWCIMSITKPQKVVKE